MRNLPITYLIFSFITNNNEEGSMFGLDTVLDQCVHTGIDDLFHHA